MRIFWSTAFIIVCMLAIAWLFQGRLIYYPSRAPLSTLAESAKRNDLEPWLAKNGRQIGWKTTTGNVPILIFHGNAGNALDRAGHIGRLEAAGISGRYHILEYPGYGFREGSPSERALVEAGTEALDELGSAVVLGESLGTGVACAVAARRPEKVRALILVTPFDSLASAGKIHYPVLPVGLLLSERYDSVKALEKFHGPVVVIVAEADTVVPAVLGRRLYDSYAGPKKLFALPESGHNEALWDLSDDDWRKAADFTGAGRP